MPNAGWGAKPYADSGARIPTVQDVATVVSAVGPITYEFTRQFLLTDPLIRHSVAPIDAAGMAVEEMYIFSDPNAQRVMAVLAFFVNSSAGIVPREIDVPVVVVRFSN